MSYPSYGGGDSPTYVLLIYILLALLFTSPVVTAVAKAMWSPGPSVPSAVRRRRWGRRRRRCRRRPLPTTTAVLLPHFERPAGSRTTSRTWYRAPDAMSSDCHLYSGADVDLVNSLSFRLQVGSRSGANVHGPATFRSDTCPA
jgi:hypothetical protein